ncbi:acyltransferase family protein [Mucilaginibacter angelicae]|uniref:Acyltransferase family protein n=1 Tax=Mucilaginibacter angelicae TaxID=869718 RepID=A0ABV6LFJ4_9SPHI
MAYLYFMPLDIDYQIIDKPGIGSQQIVIDVNHSKKPPGKAFHYIPALDNIRGLAVLFVLLTHMTYGVIKGGLVGVELFFVLSGFIITSLLQAESAAYGKISIWRFYLRRALRLFPPLLICIILANVFWSYNEVSNSGSNQSFATIAALFYFINLLPEKVSGHLVHLWSLSVEEHFYLFWPLITSFFLFKFSRRNQIKVLLTLILIVSVYRFWQGHFETSFYGGLLIIDPLRFTLCSVDSILTGALLAVAMSTTAFKNFSLNNKLRNWLIAGCVVVFSCFLVLLTGGFIFRNGGFLLLDVFCAGAIFIAIKSPGHFLFSNKVLKWLGTRSYGIYVYHYVIFAVFEHFRVHNSGGNFIIISLLRIVVSLLFAELSFRLVEMPLLKFKKKWDLQR